MADDRSAPVSLTLSASSPTRHNWRKAELGKLFPGEIRQAADAVGTFNDTFKTILETTKGYLQLAKALAAAASVDPLEAALREALQQIEEFIDALLGDTTAHAIMIPIQKQYFGLGDPIPSSELDPTAITPKYDTLINDGAIPKSLVKTLTPDTVTFVNNASTALGGNAGFYKELVLSLQDPGDFAKPDFPQNFAVTGVALIFGSSALTDLYRIISLLNRLLNMGLRADMASRSQPIASNLKARIMPMPTKGTIGVQLDWDPVPPVLIKPLFSADKSIIKEIFIIRSTDPQIRERFSWRQNFPAEPSNTQTDLPSTNTAKVLTRIRNDGFIARYIDNDKDLKIGKAYYYALALRYTINGVAQPMSNLSNVVRVYYTGQPGTSRASEPPDWFATPSLIQLFPILQTISSQIKLFVEGMLTRTVSNNGIVDMIEQTIAQIELLLQQAEQVAALLEEIENLIRDLGTADNGGMYVTSFDVRTGGIYAWTSELARRMSNRQDTSRPPFDNGELVAGFVMVAGAPNLPNLNKIRDLFKLFFGSGAGDALKPAKVATQQFTSAVTPTKLGFSANMSATRYPITATIPALVENSVTQNKPVFDTTLQPSETLDDC